MNRALLQLVAGVAPEPLLATIAEVALALEVSEAEAAATVMDLHSAGLLRVCRTCRNTPPACYSGARVTIEAFDVEFFFCLTDAGRRATFPHEHAKRARSGPGP